MSLPRSLGDEILQKIRVAIGMTGFTVMILGAGLVLLFQVLTWLKTGGWVEIPLSTFITPFPASGMVGFDRVIAWLFDAPASAVMVVLGFLWGHVWTSEW